MADAVATQTISDGAQHATFKFTNVSDGTGESAVTKIDVSSLSVNPVTKMSCSSVSIEKIYFSNIGMGVKILFDADTDVLAIQLPADWSDEFDFSDFSKVQNPDEIKKITKVLRRIVQSSGGQGVHILTARAAYKPIRQYLKDIGINMSKIYVTALASNNPKDKADWIEDKIDNEGYDDIYFADDSLKNVNATKQMLRRKDVRWRVQHIKH